MNWEAVAALAVVFGVLYALARSLADPDVMVGIFSPFGPIAVLAGVYLMTLVFTEVVTNNAAAALAFPVALAAARGLDVNILPFVVVVAVAASAGFATPLGYQTHLMVYGVGGYRFGDYLRIGIPLDVVVMAVTVTIVPMAFPL